MEGLDRAYMSFKLFVCLFLCADIPLSICFVLVCISACYNFVFFASVRAIYDFVGRSSLMLLISRILICKY